MRKVKKLNSDGDSEVIEIKTKKKVPAKKAVKKPEVFKLGKWNPEIVLLKQEDEKERFGLSDTLSTPCCIVCNCRNVVRACETNNVRLMAQCLKAKDTIPEMCLQWSVDSHTLNPLEIILKK